jgi:oligoendopeptidase F
MSDTLAIPSSAYEALDWGLEEFSPYFDRLLTQDLKQDNLHQWMSDWSSVSKLASEVGSRLYVAVTVDTTDEAAEARYMRFNEDILPQLRLYDNKLQAKLVASGLTPENFDVQLKKFHADLDLFREENLPLFTQQEGLGVEYDKIIGSQTVEWDGEEVTLSQLSLQAQNKDREIREDAWRSAMERTLKDRGALNDLWTELMDIRGKIAANAGKADYREYMWQAMSRFDYTPDNSIQFQEAIEQVVVPAARRLYERRRQRLGLSTLRPWDLEVEVTDAPPLRPYKSSEELERKTMAVFDQVDPVLGDYFRVMRDENLLDLDNRKGKAPGGYCTDFPFSSRPFIFMNAVGIHDDVQTMLHEGGHAFHVFEAAHLSYYPQQDVPTEFAEVASMSMELLASPYLSSEEGFYSEAEAARARIEHLEGIIKFWPYMAVVDAFQHWVYTHHQEASNPANCDAKWSELWDRFMVGIDYTDLEDVKEAGWHRKLHIFQIPFYYVEYGLAQLGAVQVWANSRTDQQKSVARYRHALSLGDTVSLPELFKAAGARFAFDAETLQQAVDLIEEVISELERAERAL